jgi:uroporphyrinogen-III synthase
MSSLLAGARVLVTRPAHQAETLSRLIAEHGGTPIGFPALEVIASDHFGTAKALLQQLDNFQWLVFISANAVNFALKANGGKIPCLKSVHYAAVGQATARAMAMAGLPVDLVPEQGYNSEALLAMPQMQDVTGQRFLIVRGEGGREELADTLRSRGATVSYLEVYKRIQPVIDSAPVLSLLDQHRLDAVTVTSAEALQNLLHMIGKDHHELLLAIPLVVVSDRIRSVAAGLGFKRITVTDNPADPAILEAVTIVCNGE